MEGPTKHDKPCNVWVPQRKSYTIEEKQERKKGKQK